MLSPPPSDDMRDFATWEEKVADSESVHSGNCGDSSVQTTGPLQKDDAYVLCNQRHRFDEQASSFCSARAALAAVNAQNDRSPTECLTGWRQARCGHKVHCGSHGTKNWGNEPGMSMKTKGDGFRDGGRRKLRGFFGPKCGPLQKDGAYVLCNQRHRFDEQASSFCSARAALAAVNAQNDRSRAECLTGWRQARCGHKVHSGGHGTKNSRNEPGMSMKTKDG